MPSLPSCKLFITLSHSSIDSFSGTKKYLDFCKKQKVHLIIQESGKKGTHSHYHIYVHLDKAKRADNYKRELIKQYYPDIKDESERLHMIDVKAVTDLVKLIGWYFQKEDKFKIISSRDVDMAEYKRIYNATIQPVKIRPSYACKFVSLNDLPFYIIEHIEKNKIQMIDKDYAESFKKSKKKSSDAISEMYTNFSIKFTTIWMSLFTKHKLPMHTYDRQQETIKKYIFDYFKNKI